MLLIWTGKDPRGGLEHWKTIFHFKHSHSHVLLQSRKEIHKQKTNYRQRKQTSLFLAYDFFDQVLTEIAGAAASDSLILAPANNLKHQNDKNRRNIEEAFLARWLTCNSVALYYLFVFLWLLLVFFQPYGLPFVRHKKAQNKTVTGEFIRDKMGVKKAIVSLILTRNRHRNMKSLQFSMWNPASAFQRVGKLLQHTASPPRQLQVELTVASRCLQLVWDTSAPTPAEAPSLVLPSLVWRLWLTQLQ